MQNSKTIWAHVDARKEDYEALSDRVWGMPELAYGEFRSVVEHRKMLEQEGFRITENVAGIPTAVVGEAGEGGPVIAILGEYDALPGLLQVAGIAEPKEVEAGGHGHGCGHNMLGSAALLAATAVKNYLAEKGLKGRVRYYGCPAEEGGAAANSRTSTSPSAGIRAPSTASMTPTASPTPASISPSRAAPRTRPPRRIWAAARSMPWS